MTVKELIEALQKMPQDMETVVQNGMDPSDWSTTQTVRQQEIEPFGGYKGTYVLIYS